MSNRRRKLSINGLAFFVTLLNIRFRFDKTELLLKFLNVGFYIFRAIASR